MPAADNDLARFVEAQALTYADAIAELRAGHKVTHWMWFVLPQLRGLGSSSMAQRYGIASANEARDYLAHPILGTRLRECVAAMNAQVGTSAASILGAVDAAKFRSCLTLFLAADPDVAALQLALRTFYDGVRDQRTLAMLAES